MNKGSAEKDALVLYHREGHVGFITLNRSEKRNALNLALWEALDTAVSRAESDTEARVVLVRGAGESFCAGIDLGPDNELISAIGGEPGAAQTRPPPPSSPRFPAGCPRGSPRRGA